MYGVLVGMYGVDTGVAKKMGGLKARRKRGSAKPAMLAVSQLQRPQTKWLHMDELKQMQCHLSLSEYTALISWLSPSAPHPDRPHPRLVTQRPTVLTSPETPNSNQFSPCIAGTVVDTIGNDQLIFTEHAPCRTSRQGCIWHP